MVGLVTCKNEEDPSKNDCTRSQYVSHYMSMGIFQTQGQLTPKSLSDLAEFRTHSRFMVVLVTCKNKEDPIKIEGARVVTRFSPIITLWELSVAMRHQSSDPIWPKILCSQSPTPMMLQMKYYYDPPAGLRDIHVGKCGRTHERMDGRRLESHTISSP